MISSLKEKIRKTGARLRQRNDRAQTPCIHRNPTRRTKNTHCCGAVEIFHCARLDREVHHTKCCTCDEYSTRRVRSKTGDAVFVCHREGEKETARDGGTCSKHWTPGSPSTGFRVLNARLVPSVPTIPTAKPDVRFFELHGQHVAFDANSLCAVHLDESLARPLRNSGADTFRGLLFSRQKPQFRLSRAAPVRRVVLSVTHACNLACTYCFAGGNQSQPSMSKIVATKGLGLLDPRSTVDIAFFGGEPLLEWDLICRTIDDAESLARKRGVKSKFHITTNGLLLDRKKVDFLSQHSCSVLVSLDGPEAIHNRYRPARDPGINSFRAVMDALDAAKGTPLGRRLMTRATFDAADAHLMERLEFFAGLSDAGVIQGFSVEPAVLGEGCAQRSGGLDRNRIADEYHAAAEWFVQRARTRRRADFFHYRKLIQRILYAKHSGTECGAGIGYVTVGTDGTLYACHREAGTQVGHVDYGFDEQARAAWMDNRVYARPGCASCWARYLCGGGCRQACLELAGDLHAPVPERCFLQQTLLKECLWILTQLSRNEITRVVKP